MPSFYVNTEAIAELARRYEAREAAEIDRLLKRAHYRGGRKGRRAVRRLNAFAPDVVVAGVERAIHRDVAALLKSDPRVPW